ncbi:MAG: imidazoleglycerol-phosphate dehydratase HisB [Clostridia bacterium]|nr:imidazoleglycerol-phosphate dehydratase HisB [Clostridia bacterium]MBQ1996756.1 imidazoleglycerol-phosphate dehydratase HisB [Clostridia bacterium]MBQ5905925.1 imidazoleglycerol-phosphate dehydratase HisB [Clostridia bacterium]
MRSAEIIRTTAETDISLKLNLDGEGVSEINTGSGFLNHMLTLFARHGNFDLTVNCKGDIDVDYHHTAEDIGICLGEAFRKALGDMKGITRYAHIILPMDESLILSAVDISGRSFLSYTADIPTEKVGDFDTELVREFFEAFVRKAEITLHIKQLDGYNSHHIIEGMFKSVARSMKAAVAIDEKNKDKIPSTKGVL